MTNQPQDVYLASGELIRNCTVREHPALWMFMEIKTEDGEVRAINSNSVEQFRPALPREDRPPIVIL